MENTTCIITTMKGREKLLERAIISAQLNNFEEILVVGESDIDTTKYDGINFQIFAEEKTLPEKYNWGIDNAKCEYLMFLNDDDMYLRIPDSYDNDNAFTFSDFFMMKKGDLGRCNCRPLVLKDNNYIGYMTVKVKRSIMLDNKFSLDHKFYCDYEMWLRLKSKGVPFVYIQTSFAIYDTTNAGRVSDVKKEEIRKELIDIKEKYKNV